MLLFPYNWAFGQTFHLRHLQAFDHFPPLQKPWWAYQLFSPWLISWVSVSLLHQASCATPAQMHSFQPYFIRLVLPRLPACLARVENLSLNTGASPNTPRIRQLPAGEGQRVYMLLQHPFLENRRWKQTKDLMPQVQTILEINYFEDKVPSLCKASVLSR